MKLSCNIFSTFESHNKQLLFQYTISILMSLHFVIILLTKCTLGLTNSSSER